MSNPLPLNRPARPDWTPVGAACVRCDGLLKGWAGRIPSHRGPGRCTHQPVVGVMGAPLHPLLALAAELLQHTG